MLSAGVNEKSALEIAAWRQDSLVDSLWMSNAVFDFGESRTDNLEIELSEGKVLSGDAMDIVFDEW